MSLLVLLPRITLERQSDVRKKVAIGTTIGLTVGAVAGVLFAPKAGKETRDDLAQTFHELPDKAKELSDRAHKSLTEVTLVGLNEDILKSKWQELKGSIKAKWWKLNDDDLATVDGESEKLMGILQTRYGYSQKRAQEEYESFLNANRQKAPME